MYITFSMIIQKNPFNTIKKFKIFNLNSHQMKNTIKIIYSSVMKALVTH